MNIKKASLLILIFCLPLTDLFMHLDSFAFPIIGEYSDLLITHYPNALYLLRSINEWQQIPLWSNTILSGYPFIANPLAGVLYPAGWIAYLFPLPFGFNLAVIIHLVFGAFGMYLFLLRSGLKNQPAIAGALIFELLPRLWAHHAAGHLTLVYAFCWTPWLLWNEHDERAQRLYLTAVILGMIALADVRWVAYAGILWFAFRLSRLTYQSRGRIRAWLTKSLLTPLLGIGLAAPLILPMLEYVGLSTRRELTQADHFGFSIQPAQYMGFVFPDILGNVEWIIYPGAVCVIALVWAWADGALRKQTRFIRWGLVVAVLLSLGENFAPSNWLLSLPGFDLLRVPSRFMLVGGVLCSVLAGQWINYLFESFDRYSKAIVAIRLALVGFFALSAGLTALIWAINGAPPANLIWGCVGYLVLWVALFRYISQPYSRQLLTAILIAICLLDLVTLNHLRMKFRPGDVVNAQNSDVGEYLASKAGFFRVYSPSYSVPQHVAGNYGLELADGIDPLQLKDYVQFFGKASGIEPSGYSVTLPQFKTAAPEKDNINSIPASSLLGLLNVRYIAAEYPLPGAGLDLVAQFSKTWIYENPMALPRTWVQGIDSPLGEGVKSVPEIAWSPNQIQLLAEGPGLLVLSELNYPGWTIEVDGRDTGLSQPGSILRGIELKPGTHTVIFRFFPTSLIWGLAVSVVSGLILIINYFKVAKR